MSDKDDQSTELDDITDEEAEQLLGDAVREDEADKERESDKDDRDWKAEAEKWKSLSRKHEKTATTHAARLKELDDKGKTELQRLVEERDSGLTRAQKAEAALKRREIAELIAPEHATARQIAQVAKRMTGDDDDALESDAKELFDWIAPAKDADTAKPGAKTTGRPQPRLKGGTADPDEDPEETDPRKLAALITRRR